MRFKNRSHFATWTVDKRTIRPTTRLEHHVWRLNWRVLFKKNPSCDSVKGYCINYAIVHTKNSVVSIYENFLKRNF